MSAGDMLIAVGVVAVLFCAAGAALLWFGGLFEWWRGCDRNDPYL